MKITTLWVVRDPTPDSEFADVCWETSVSRLSDYILGAEAGHICRSVWRGEDHTLYTEEAEARADAEARMTKVRPVAISKG